MRHYVSKDHADFQQAPDFATARPQGAHGGPGAGPWQNLYTLCKLARVIRNQPSALWQDSHIGTNLSLKPQITKSISLAAR